MLAGKKFRGFGDAERILEKQPSFYSSEVTKVTEKLPICSKEPLENGIPSPSKIRNCEVSREFSSKKCETCEQKFHQNFEFKPSLSKLV